MSGIPSWAIVGAKVCCLRGNFTASVQVNEPVPGQVYTIRTIELYGQGVVGIRLVEVVNNTANWRDRTGKLKLDWEPAFPLAWFRPLVTRTIEQDLAIFRPIIDQVPEHDPA